MTSFHPFIHNNRIWSAPLPAILMNGMLNPAEKEVALAGLCLTHLRPVSAERTRRSTSGTTRVGRGGGAAGCCLSCRSCLRLLSQGAVLTQVQKLLHRHLPARLLTPTLLPNRSIVSSSCCNPPPPPDKSSHRCGHFGESHAVAAWRDLDRTQRLSDELFMSYVRVFIPLITSQNIHLSAMKRTSTSKSGFCDFSTFSSSRQTAVQGHWSVAAGRDRMERLLLVTEP